MGSVIKSALQEISLYSPSHKVMLYHIQGDAIVFRAVYDVMFGASKHRFSLRPFSKPTGNSCLS